MKNLLLLGALLLFSTTLTAQCCPYIIGIETIPENPQAGENVTIITHVATPNMGYILTRNHVIENDTIRIDACYHSGMLTVVTVVDDTIDIGPLDAGIYGVVFRASVSDDPVECIPVDQNQLDTTIAIGSTHLIDAEMPRLSAYPNPTKDVITLHQAVEHICVVDANGRQVFVLMSIVGNETVLDTRNLAPGCYLITTVLNGKTGRALFLKE